ncbi:unnamed protein product [Allacma fusca]|uniref:ubiquitinyl hydrolase 1 n=1 Tax=Allacma fusca TaxID=39272 RepID=A0A8J2KXM8_9HEXA|nr:unnamed protein product [Allacma fusca]
MYESSFDYTQGPCVSCEESKMGNGKICDCCMDFTSLLQSYDGKRVPVQSLQDINISREEVETIFLYMQSWTQRQCSCCFRDSRNFERFNWAIQIFIIVVIEILKHFPRSDKLPAVRNDTENSVTGSEEKEGTKGENDNHPAAPAMEVSCSKAVWEIEDKDKIIHFVSKVFLNSFPTYVAYKQHLQVKNEEVTPQEIQGLSQYCEINEPEASPYLFRNVALFCKLGGMEAVSTSIAGHSPETLPISQANLLVALVTNLKSWFNFQSLLKYFVPFRSTVLAYMCKLVDTELKSAHARNMAEYIWGAVKDPVDAHMNFDKDGLDLAFKYFLSSTLTMRLAGVNQINNHINLFNELINSEHILNTENLDQELCKWLLENQIIQHIFGPNLHVEVIKQSHTILTFLAMEGKIQSEHIDIIWQAAQLKHCSKQVYDILSSLICNMEPGPVLHLHNLLRKLEPKDHTEQSLYLASALIKFIWTNATAALDSLPINANMTSKFRGRTRTRVVEPSSSENSVVAPDSTDDDSLSGVESGKSDDPDNVQLSSGGYIETHSDSDADEERSGNEETGGGKKPKRKILRRKKNQNTNNSKGPSPGNTSKDGGTEIPQVECDVSVQSDAITPNKADISVESSGQEPVADSMEPTAVINELSNLVHMTESSIMQDFVSAPDLLEGSDGSYSSRISNKSEKNMADFDGEDSPCEDEIMQSLTQTQLAELTARNQGLRLGNIGPVFGPRPVRSYGRRRRFHVPPTFNFQLESVCQPGQTLLWDLIQDDKITLLSEGLAIEAQKALTNLLCFNTDKLIRFKFIEGCLENLSNNRSIVISLRLLPKLLTSFQQIRVTSDIHQVTLWADRERDMMPKFFANLKEFRNQEINITPFPFHANVQVRLEFLSVVFSSVASPDDFRLTIDQVDQLWECLATDCRSSDDLFLWLTGQVRLRDQHALSPEAFRHIFIRKLPSLPPETVTMHALTLFQQLCNMARTSGEKDVEAAASSMDYLWKIALCANSTDVSMTAIQYLNGYYISRQLEKEEEFVQRCMSHLAEATEELTHCTPSDEAPLLRIQRALLLLKTHLETFRRRYAYHLRKWFLEGRGVGSHAQLVGEKGAVPIRVVIQPAGYHEKVTLELLSSDYVADLRAEVAKWWETIQGNLAAEKTNSTPVLGSLLTEGPIRMITQGIELSAEYDEKFLSEVPVKDLQLVYVSMGASRPQKKKDAMEYSSSLPPPPRDKLPVTLLLQTQYFEQLFSLMQSLSSIKIQDRPGGSVPHTKAQVLSRRVWDILMLLPTNPAIHEGFITMQLGNEGNSFDTLLNPASPQKLMYSLYIVEALVKINSVKNRDSHDVTFEPNTWRQNFTESGGLRHLFDIFASGVLESVESGDWSEWKQDCLASLLKILCYLGVMSEDTDCLNEQLYDVNDVPRKRAKRRKTSSEKTLIPRLNDKVMSMMNVELVMTRLTNILQACSLPRDPNHYKTGFWGRAQVVHYAMALLVCWAFSCEEVRPALYAQKDFPQWLRRLVLEDPEPSVRREVCTGLYRLCLGVSSTGKTGISYAPELISHLLKCLSASLAIKPQQRCELPVHTYEEGKEPYGPACRDYFWLLGRLLDCLDEDFIRDSVDDPDNCAIDLDGLAQTLSKHILNREYLETRHNTVTDDGLVGLLNTITVVLKHNPPFKASKDGQHFLKQMFECLFALPSPSKRYLPKCKSQACRQAAFDLLNEMCRSAVQNYYLLQNLLMDQHQPTSHAPYPWDYWPHDDGRSSCGYVGLTNLGATCYMASCMQHLYMMPQARASILSSKFSAEVKHEQTLRELQRMFAYLMESERKAYNPRSFCKVYQMDHQPLNTGEQKDMAEFFIDLVSKLEEMTPELKKLVKTLFCGVTSNNVVSLDCPHVSRTLEEFYTVRCQVADMRNLFESLDEVTVKDTLEGDNMYTCSQCGKKVRAEKRACFKKLPRILCFNTMRYTFNMITMMKEKVNTHFSFPLHLDMTGYTEKTLMPQQYLEEKMKKQASKKDDDSEGNSGNQDQDVDEEECYEYDLIGVTVHTGTADGGHYYSFIRDRVSPNKDKWYLFNDAEVKPFDPNQIAAECFGGEMSTKTYDSVTDKFMDFSFEKTNSAYMLFYERCTQLSSQLAIGEGSLVPSLPGGSSQKQHHAQVVVPLTVELSKELEDWIWQDNMHFLRDKNIFEHTYFTFMWQSCGAIPQSLMSQEDVSLMAAKLSVTFFLETFIHAKEKPTMVQWVELLTKQLSGSVTAAAWLLDHMAETDWWPVQILLKCPNQMVRQMFQRLCIHVINQLRPRHCQLYLKFPDGQIGDHPNDINMDEFGSFSCVTRFIKRLLSLLEHGAKSHLKHLTEYFTFLHDFSKMGDDECLFLINMQAISAMVDFYLGNKKEDQADHGSDEEEEEEEIVTIPAEKSKVASLEKMIALVATLVEKSRDETNALRLSTNDWNALTGGGKNFPFILQQIRDGINFTSTRNLIFSMCRWNDKLAESIVIAIFQAIQKHPDVCHPFFKVLNLLAELVAVPPGMPSFTELILSRVLDVADICPYPTLEWLGAQVPRNKIVHSWCLNSMDTWVEHFLIAHANQRVRNAAASLLVSLVPNHHFRQGYRTTKMYGGHCRELIALSAESQNILHDIYIRLLGLLKPARHYTDVIHGTTKLTAYFAVLSYFTVSKQEKLMFGQYFLDLWQLFHPKLSEPGIPCHHNKQALLTFWHHVCVDCVENIHKIVHNPMVVKQIGFNYILADHEDQEVVMFNRSMLPAYYAILRMCCQTSRSFALQLARHQNITWAFKNISPYPTQYPAAVDELFKIMQIFVSKTPETSEQELQEIAMFKRSTLQLYLQILDGRSNWSTLISAFRILVETFDDRVFVVCNNGLNLKFEALHILHTMHHEATACHVTGEIVELLTIMTEILRSFRPKEFAHGMQVYNPGEIQITRFISSSKEWPEVLRKLATLLNTYNCADLRNNAIETLIEFLYIMPLDCLRTLVPLMVHCHSACQDAHTSGMGTTMGPYFPKRSNHGGVTIKPAVRPPRPMLQMAFPHIGHEIAKGNDEEYDRQLHEFYSQYHVFVDLMCRVAFMKDCVNQELITLSAMVGYEAAPLHFIHFPKLWLEVFNTPTLDRKYLTMLVNTNYFTDYVELIVVDERACLANLVIFNFLASLMSKVYDQIASLEQIIKVVKQILGDFRTLVTKKISEIELVAVKILGDLKALQLFYLPTITGKGNSKQPMPEPAPSMRDVYKSLRALHSYLESLSARKILETSTGEAPSKKRKVDSESCEKESNSSSESPRTRHSSCTTEGSSDTEVPGPSSP